MDNETLVALKESINIWEPRGRDRDYWKACPLCVLGKKKSIYKCDDCIIKKRTGEGECHGTPFWSDKDNFPIYEENMVRYLESFLPKDKEEAKMRFVIKDYNHKGKNIEVELSLEYGSDEFVRICANSRGENRKILMIFKDGKFKRCWGAQTDGVDTNIHGQITENEGV